MEAQNQETQSSQIDPEQNPTQQIDINIQSVVTISSNVFPSQENSDNNVSGESQGQQQTIVQSVEQIDFSLNSGANENMQSINESQDINHDLAFSLTEMQVEAERDLQRLRYMRYDVTQSGTVVIAKDPPPKQPYEDEKYFMGYFKWFWSSKGFFQAMWHFMAKKTISSCFYCVFYNIGLAIGAFFFRKLVIPHLSLEKYC